MYLCRKEETKIKIANTFEEVMLIRTSVISQILNLALQNDLQFHQHCCM